VAKKRKKRRNKGFSIPTWVYVVGIGLGVIGFIMQPPKLKQ